MTAVTDETISATVGEAPAPPVRMMLVTRAPSVARWHLLRSVARVLVLLLADSVTLILLRSALLGLRDASWLGGTVASPLQILFPPGQYSSLKIAVALLLGIAVSGNYGPGDQRRDPARVLAGVGLGVTVTLWASLWSDVGLVALAVLFVVTAAVTLAFTAERFVVNALIPATTKVERIAVLGPRRDATDTLTLPALTGRGSLAVSAWFDPAEHDGAMATELGQLIERERIDTVVISGRLAYAEFAAALDVSRTSGCRVLSLSRPRSNGSSEPKVVHQNGMVFLELTQPTRLAAQLAIKRAVDVALSGTGLVLLAPLFGLVALAVRFSSAGPVLFHQLRIGQGGRRFRILKFRTMVADAEAQRDALELENCYRDGRLFKLTFDPRVTRLGAFLRHTSLDELPQLWNVLVGDMSLVGPRPPLPSEVALYEAHHYARFDMKPGITGPWQVNGRSLVCDFEKVVQFETAYIRNWSLWLDLILLLRTIPAVLSGRGAQ
jgi:exopolysaccharide biosynthesis polyprenyl glycosylphosphotransferase